MAFVVTAPYSVFVRASPYDAEYATIWGAVRWRVMDCVSICRIPESIELLYMSGGGGQGLGW
jgi:hypothetical protein